MQNFLKQDFTRLLNIFGLKFIVLVSLQVSHMAEIYYYLSSELFKILEILVIDFWQSILLVSKVSKKINE